MINEIFDKFKVDDPVKIRPGDSVIFYKINKKEFSNWNE